MFSIFWSSVREAYIQYRIYSTPYIEYSTLYTQPEQFVRYYIQYCINVYILSNVIYIYIYTHTHLPIYTHTNTYTYIQHTIYRIQHTIYIARTTDTILYIHIYKAWKNPRKHLASFGLAYWTSNPCSKKKKLIGIFRSGVLDYEKGKNLPRGVCIH